MTTRVLFDGLPLAVAGDPTGPRAVIVIQEAFGVNDHIREVTDRFASQGYYAVAPELFHRVGSPEVPYDDFPAAMAAMATLGEAGIGADLDAAVAHLAEEGFERRSIAIFGFPPLLELAPQLACDWIGLYGDLDKGIPVEQVEALRAAVSSSGHVTEVVRYADADHGFHCDGRPGVFNAAAAADAHQRTLAFFRAHLEDK